MEHTRHQNNTDECQGTKGDHRNKRQRITDDNDNDSVKNQSDSIINNSSNNGSDQESDQNEDDEDENQDEDEDTVLSEVHIHPENGLVDRRVITSVFHLSRTDQDTTENNDDHSSLGHDAAEDTHTTECSYTSMPPQHAHPMGNNPINKTQEKDKDENNTHWDYAVKIKHAMGTDLRGVGSQVWMGCFLLIDWVVHIKQQLSNSAVIELGAGTGLASIAASLLTSIDRTYCTDYDGDVLENCKTNIGLNCNTNDSVIITRRLNWLMDDPLDPVQDDYPDHFAWSSQERQDWKDNGAFILAADGTVYNFSLDRLAVVAQAYDYFKIRIGRSRVIEAEEIDASTLARHCDYNRTKDLVLFRIICR
ncbi:Methyltransferase-like protein 22 [Mortierella sp. AD031]|nr:Methyltransferase-like protein 22 [Mortierella sp. AD031]